MDDAPREPVTQEEHPPAVAAPTPTVRKKPRRRKKDIAPPPKDAVAIEAELVDEKRVLDETWHRRMRVQTLRLRGFTQTQIATALQVNQSTVSRDLDWIREHRKDQFGVHPNFDAADELGEAMALFQDVEMSALRDYARLPTNAVKDRNACLRTAIFTRLSRLNVLQDQGILQRKIGEVGITLRADAVRASLLRDGLLLPSGAKMAEATFPDGDPVDAWMRTDGDG